MPAEIQSHIFEPFFTTKGVGEGKGLECEAVQRSTRRIQVNSKSEDARFQVWFPLAEASAAQPT